MWATNILMYILYYFKIIDPLISPIKYITKSLVMLVDNMLEDNILIFKNFTLNIIPIMSKVTITMPLIQYLTVTSHVLLKR